MFTMKNLWFTIGTTAFFKEIWSPIFKIQQICINFLGKQKTNVSLVLLLQLISDFL